MLELGEEEGGAIAELAVHDAQLIEARSTVRLGPMARRDHGLAGRLRRQKHGVLLGSLLVFEHLKPRLEPIPVFDDDMLRRLTLPVLVVIGGRDAMLDSAFRRRWGRQVGPGASGRAVVIAWYADRAPATWSVAPYH